MFLLEDDWRLESDDDIGYFFMGDCAESDSLVEAVRQLKELERVFILCITPDCSSDGGSKCIGEIFSFGKFFW